MKRYLVVGIVIVAALFALSGPASARTVKVDINAKSTKMEVLFEAARLATVKACKGEPDTTKVRVVVHRKLAAYGYNFRCGELLELEPVK